jgi:O-methyltransferase domain
VHAMGSPPPAARVLDLAHGAAHTHILGTLARLRIADHVADQPRSVAALASMTGADPDRLNRLLRAATVLGLVQRTTDGLITMTEVGACLRSGPGSLHDFALMLSAPGQLRPLEHLTEAVCGEAAAEAALGQSLWDYYRAHPDEGAAFAGAMSGVSAMIAGQVAAAADAADSQRIVDVGGGQGTLLRALLATAPQAEGVLLDLPEVVAAAPPAERIQFTGGDFLASVPAGGDVYVLCHVLHDWDDPDAQRILTACRRAATPASRLLIVEAVLADQPGPVMPELLDVHMMVMSGGRERRRDQFGQLLDAAGWQLAEVTLLPSGQSLLNARAR